MNFRLTLIAAAFWPMCAFSAGFPSLSSEIPWVQLWTLGIGESGFPEAHFEDESNEFIRHCNGARSIYVGSSDSPIRCKSECHPNSICRIVLNTKDSRLSGPVVVSKEPLPSRVNALPVSDDEVERLKKVEEIAKADFSINVPHENDADARAWLETWRKERLPEITKEATYRKRWNTRYKLLGSSGAIYISPIEVFSDGCHDEGWSIQYAVFRETGGRLEKMGAISGCIGGFRDINGDGTPEVFTSTCANSGGVYEGQPYRYWSLTPAVHSVVEYDSGYCC